MYRAHSASVTTLSISPYPPPLPTAKPDAVNRISFGRPDSLARSPTTDSSKSPASKNVKQPQVPSTPSNSIHIATSSIDGNVCVASLVDTRDILLRNFGRPVQAVALSPDYKNDRTYLSGGLAGNLVMTVGGRPGTSSTSNTTGGAAATASGWLGTIGLGSNNGNDTVLHSGEGSISTIKWSLTGKYVVWVNEQGIKIIRSNLRLDTADTDFSWKRFSHIDRPNRPGWDEMASVWKARADWIDESGLESDEEYPELSGVTLNKDEDTQPVLVNGQPVKRRQVESRIEKLIIGWAGTIWIINVRCGNSGVGKEGGERKAGIAEVVNM